MLMPYFSSVIKFKMVCSQFYSSTVLRGSTILIIIIFSLCEYWCFLLDHNQCIRIYRHT